MQKRYIDSAQQESEWRKRSLTEMGVNRNEMHVSNRKKVVEVGLEEWIPIKLWAENQSSGFHV